MVKMYQKTVENLSEFTRELSILESRVHNQAVGMSISGGLHPRSTPQRIVLCRKAGHAVPRGLRKSSSLTNGMSPGKDKTALREYAKEGPRSFLLPKSLSMRPSWALR
jgi:hypothetical protein